MYLFDIVPGAKRKPHWRFRVLGVSKTDNIGEKNSSELVKFFQSLKPSEVAGFMDLFVRYCEFGKEGLTSKMFHSCDANRNLHQFRKGDYRITCFIEEGDLVICSHGFLKSGDKTPPKDQNKTDALRKTYRAAKAKGECQFIK